MVCFPGQPKHGLSLDVLNLLLNISLAGLSSERNMWLDYGPFCCRRKLQVGSYFPPCSCTGEEFGQSGNVAALRQQTSRQESWRIVDRDWLAGPSKATTSLSTLNGSCRSNNQRIAVGGILTIVTQVPCWLQCYSSHRTCILNMEVIEDSLWLSCLECGGLRTVNDQEPMTYHDRF